MSFDVDPTWSCTVPAWSERLRRRLPVSGQRLRRTSSEEEELHAANAHAVHQDAHHALVTVPVARSAHRDHRDRRIVIGAKRRWLSSG
jgi:hypothetical protein